MAGDTVVVVVHQAVAVVVDAVADFRRAGVDRCVAVVAVAVIIDRTTGLLAGGDRTRAVAVAVRIRVPGALAGDTVVVVVHQAVAVVVDAVAGLGGVGVDREVRVVAVTVAAGPAVAVGVEAFVHEAVAVVVDAVADLLGAGVDVVVVVVAVGLGAALAVDEPVHRLAPQGDVVALSGGVGVADLVVAVGREDLVVGAEHHPAVAVLEVGVHGGAAVGGQHGDRRVGDGHGGAVGPEHRVDAVADGMAGVPGVDGGPADEVGVAVEADAQLLGDGVDVGLVEVGDQQRRATLVDVVQDVVHLVLGEAADGLGDDQRVVVIHQLEAQALGAVGVPGVAGGQQVIDGVAPGMAGGVVIGVGPGVLAVDQVDEHVTLGGVAAGGVAVTVGVEVLVDGAVAVVVDAVAVLGGARVDRGVAVVAVVRAGGPAVTVSVEVLVDGAVEIVVDSVADLFLGAVLLSVFVDVDVVGGRWQAVADLLTSRVVVGDPGGLELEVGGVGQGIAHQDIGEAVHVHSGTAAGPGQVHGPGDGDGAVAVVGLAVGGDVVGSHGPSSGNDIAERAGTIVVADVARGHGDPGLGAHHVHHLAGGEHGVGALVGPDVVLRLHSVAASPVLEVIHAVGVGVPPGLGEGRQDIGHRLAVPLEVLPTGGGEAGLDAPPGGAAQVGAVVAVVGGPGAVLKGQALTGLELDGPDELALDEHRLGAAGRVQAQLVDADVVDADVGEDDRAARARLDIEPAAGVGLPQGEALIGDDFVAVVVAAIQVLVHVAIAVVVQLVADFEGAGVDVGVPVVTVRVIIDRARGLVAGADRGAGVAVAVAIGVGVPGAEAGDVSVRVVHQAVAVIIVAVADLRRTGVDGRVAVVAVAVVIHRTAGLLTGGDRRGAVAVTVDVGVPGALAGDVRVVVVHQAVAVVVQAVALLAVEAVGQPVAVAVEAFVGAAVTVVVEAITELSSAGVDGRVGVVAVGVVRDVAGGGVAGCHRVGGVAVAVAVGVEVPGGLAHGVVVVVIHQAVAVVVVAVAELGGAGVDGRVGVVAVGVVGHVAFGSVAGGHPSGRIAEAVAVGVGVPGALAGDVRIVVVHQAVAVVIHPVADLAVHVVAVGDIDAVEQAAGVGVGGTAGLGPVPDLELQGVVAAGQGRGEVPDVGGGEVVVLGAVGGHGAGVQPDLVAVVGADLEGGVHVVGAALQGEVPEDGADLVSTGVGLVVLVPDPLGAADGGGPAGVAVVGEHRRGAVLEQVEAVLEGAEALLDHALLHAVGEAVAVSVEALVDLAVEVVVHTVADLLFGAADVAVAVDVQVVDRGGQGVVGLEAVAAVVVQLGLGQLEVGEVGDDVAVEHVGDLLDVQDDATVGACDGQVPGDRGGAVCLEGLAVGGGGVVAGRPPCGDGVGQRAGGRVVADVAGGQRDEHGAVVALGQLAGREDAIGVLVAPDVVVGLDAEAASPVVLVGAAITVSVRRGRDVVGEGVGNLLAEVVVGGAGRCVLAVLHAPPGLLAVVGVVIAVGGGPAAVVRVEVTARADLPGRVGDVVIEEEALAPIGGVERLVLEAESELTCVVDGHLDAGVGARGDLDVAQGVGLPDGEAVFGVGLLAGDVRIGRDRDGGNQQPGGDCSSEELVASGGRHETSTLAGMSHQALKERWPLSFRLRAARNSARSAQSAPTNVSLGVAVTFRYIQVLPEGLDKAAPRQLWGWVNRSG